MSLIRGQGEQKGGKQLQVTNICSPGVNSKHNERSIQMCGIAGPLYIIDMDIRPHIYIKRKESTLQTLRELPSLLLSLEE